MPGMQSRAGLPRGVAVATGKVLHRGRHNTGLVGRRGGVACLGQRDRLLKWLSSLSDSSVKWG